METNNRPHHGGRLYVAMGISILAEVEAAKEKLSTTSAQGQGLSMGRKKASQFDNNRRVLYPLYLHHPLYLLPSLTSRIETITTFIIRLDRDTHQLPFERRRSPGELPSACSAASMFRRQHV